MGKKGWLSPAKKAVILSYSKNKKGKRSRRSNSRKSRHGNQMMSLDTYLAQTKVALASPPMAMEVDTNDIKQPDLVAYATAMEEEPTDLEQNDNEHIMQYDSIANDAIAMEEEPAAPHVVDDKAIKIQTAYRGYMVIMIFYP